MAGVSACRGSSGALSLDVPVIQRIVRSLAVFAFALPALAATPITGVVTNKTTNKPSAGDTVTLVRLAQGMQDSTHTTTDARGHFTLQVPEEGIHLVRVTHEKANYFQPAPPGTNNVNIDVYEAAEHVEGVSTTVEEMHVEADASDLHIVEVLEVTNTSSPAMTQFSEKGFDFYLPPGASVVRAGAMRDQLPVPATAVPVGDPGHFTFLFPIRPGETQFGVIYSLPYKGSITLTPKLTTAVNTLAVVLPKSIKLTPSAGAAYTLAPANGAATDTYMIQNASPSMTLSFSLSGVGSLPRDSEGAQGQAQQGGGSGAPVAATDNTAPGKGLDNPLDPEGNRDPWAKYKYWILAGIALLMAAGAGILLRKPAGLSGLPTSTLPLSQIMANQEPLPSREGQRVALLTALKEELFSLETDHLQQRVSESEYVATKAALELVLKRALTRSNAPEVGSTR